MPGIAGNAMQSSDVRYLFDYDRWATTRVLDASVGVDEATWSTPNAIGDRGLGGILIHALGAHQRWRHGLSGGPGRGPSPESEPLPTIEQLRAAWAVEWPAMDAWLVTLDDARMDDTEDGIAYWQMLAHVVNHGTQHRSEAAALLTSAGRSPGDIDMIEFAEARHAGKA
jgi:uncharacterized damage-inducible protein DinB